MSRRLAIRKSGFDGKIRTMITVHCDCRAIVTSLTKTDRKLLNIDPVTLILTNCASRRLSERMSAIWHNQDLWYVIMSFLDSKAILQLALTNRNFHKMAMDESVWKIQCLKELHIPNDAKPIVSWKSLYAAAVDGSHSYSRRDSEAHIDWMRIGTFSIECGEVLASDRLCNLKEPSFDNKKEGSLGSLLPISNVKNGPWIADLHLLRCSVCSQQACEGTMQTLEARHWELFLDDRYSADDWKFEEVATYTIPYNTARAAAGIFDKRRFLSKETRDLLNLNSWNSAPGDWQPRGKTSKYAAASSTRLQENDGLHVTFHVLRDALDGLVLAIRVTQQLV